MEEGTKLGRYAIVGRLGTGGMGEVYLADDPRLKRQVALKVVGRDQRDDDDARHRLLREARTASALNHPGICSIFDVGEEGYDIYVAMEMLEGETLQEHLLGTAMQPAAAARLGAALAEALGHAHKRGIVHRDLKPANVIISPEGHPKILDFGLAKPLPGETIDDTDATAAVVTRHGDIMGTPAYMAPELLAGKAATPRSDIWALGVMLYEMVSGGRPFVGNTAFEVTSAILKEPTPPLPGKVPAELQHVIERCLRKDPARRLETAAEVAAVLRQGEVTIQSGIVARRRTASRSVTATAIVAIAIAAAGLAYWLGSNRPGAAPPIEALAVMPIAAASDDADEIVIADGLTEGLIEALGATGAVGRVIARGAVMRYRDAPQTWEQAASDLGAGGVITAQLQVGDQGLALEATLHTTGATRPAWNHTYQRPLESLATLPAAVAADIAAHLGADPVPAPMAVTSGSPSADPEVYRTYLRGRFLWNRRTPADLQEALDLFRQVVALDRDNAGAYAAIAQTYYLLASFGYAVISPLDAIPLAQGAATRAVELDAGLSEAQVAMAMAQMLSWNWAESARAFERGLAINPSNASARQLYSALLTALGRFGEARAQIEQARLLDPVSMVIVQSVPNVSYFAGDLDEAIRQSHTVLSLVPGFWPSLMIIGSAHTLRGEYEVAEQINADALETTGRNPFILAVAGFNYLRWQRPDDARSLYEELLARRQTGGYVSPVVLAKHQLNAGDLDDGFRLLQEAIDGKDQSLMFLAVDPQYPDRARVDPRFAAALADVRLTQVTATR